MARKSAGSVMIRILITLLGAAMILWGVGTFALGIWGESSMAAITNIRRQGGERSDGKPGRYNYAVSYTFKLPDGTLVDGFTTKISDSMYVKVSKLDYTTPVRYLKAVPAINALEEHTKPNLGQVALVFTGGFLIYAINRW